MRFARVIVAVLAIAPCVSVAQRPLVTDDADMLEVGRCHVESYVKRERRSNESEAWLLPACNPLGGFEMTAGGYRVSSSPEGSTRGLFLQGKVLFRRSTESSWGTAASFGAEAVRRSSESAIGRKSGWNPFLNLIVSGPVAGEALALRGNVAYVRDSLEGDDLLFRAVALEFPVGERIRGFVETYRTTNEKAVQHLGMLYWVVPERLWIDGSAGFQDGRFFTIGLKYFFAL